MSGSSSSHDGLFPFVDIFQEDTRYLGVEMRAAVLTDVIGHLEGRPGVAVWAVTSERVPNVHNSKDAGRERDEIAFQAAGITSTVPLFVMAIWDFQGISQIDDGGEPFMGEPWMRAHDFPLLLCETAPFEQNVIGDAHLANIM